MSETQWATLDINNVEDLDETEVVLNDKSKQSVKPDLEAVDEDQVEETETEAKSEKTEKADKDETEVKRSRRRSRAQERIKTLIAENKALRQQMSDEFSKLRTEIQSTKTSTEVDSKLSDLLTRKNVLKTDLAKAYEEGNYALIADIQAQIADLTVDEKVLKAQKLQQPRQETLKTETTIREPETPEALQEWAEDKPWLQEPETRDERKLRRYVRRVAKELTEDGLSIEDDDFYEELDERIADYVKEHDLDVDGFKTETRKTEKQKTSPVAPVKRDSSVVRKPNGQISVRLTAEERKMAEQLGVTEQEYAAQKVKMSNGTKTGYTSIF